MKISARDIMDTSFHTLSPETPVSDAVILFKRASRKENRRLFGKAADSGDTVGVCSLTDAARCRSGSCHACLSSRIHVARDRSRA